MEILKAKNISKYSNGTKIHIKEKNKGKFTEYCDGEVTQNCIDKAKNGGNPTLKKRAIFSENVRSWKHAKGGQLIPKKQVGGIFTNIKDLFLKLNADDYTYINTFESTYPQAFAHAKKNGKKYFKWNNTLFEVKHKVADPSLKDFSDKKFGEAYKQAKKENLSTFAYNSQEFNTKEKYESADVNLNKLTPKEVWERITKTSWNVGKNYTNGSKTNNLGLKNLLINLYNQGVPLNEFNWDNIEETKRKLVDYGSIRNQNDREFHHGEKQPLQYNEKIKTSQLYGFNVPQNETPITIPLGTSGKNGGTVIYPTILDSLATSAIRTGNVSPEVALGLSAQESAYGNAKNYFIRHNPYRDYYEDTPYGEQFKNNLNYYGKRQLQSSWNYSETPFTYFVRKNSYTHSSKLKSDEEVQKNIKKGWNYALNEFAKYDYTKPVIDWSFELFNAGGYNTNDKNHTSDVIKRGKDLINTPEIQNWFYNHFLPNQQHQESWLSWWNGSYLKQ